ncbi:MAG TPA: DUF5916 domain-containing protein [Pyrinomonadaceae bacterium]|jgi:hypothetical protein
MRNRLRLSAVASSGLFALVVLVACLVRVEAQTLARVSSNARRSSSSTTASASAAPAAPAKRLVPLRTNETAAGSRVVVASDAPLDDYAAYREGERFYVLIPRAEALFSPDNLEGRGFADARIERRGADVLLSFRLQPGASARVAQKFNRLDVIFTAQPQPQSPAPASSTQTPPAAQPQQPQSSTAQTPAAQPASTSTQTTGAPAASAPVAPATTTAVEQPPDSPPTAKDSTTPPAAPPPSATGASDAAKAIAGTTVSGIKLPPEKSQPVRIPRFDKPPVIDGKLDDEVWKQAATFKDFYQIRPGDNIAPSQPTVAYIGYDAKFLYLGFHAHDEQGKVRATIAKRDNIFEDDWIGVILDTYNDKRKGYELFFNPLGVQADGIMTEGAGEDFNVDIVMESKGSVVETGYIVEVAVPFKSLRYEAGKDKLWGLHILRVIKRFNNEQDSWMPISRDNSSTMGQAGLITGLENLSTERTIELIPSLTISETGRRVRTLSRAALRSMGANAVDPGRFVNQPIDFDPGLTAKFGITPTVTLDLALNPDFAQVEADATVIEANQRFPIFFAEKRPFFLEGIDIFQTIISAVHTRTIVDPDLAVKLTGKRGRNSFGLLLASDNAPGNFENELRFDPERLPDEKYIGKNAWVGILRLKRDVGRENTVGLLATSYNFIDRHNQMGGFDTRLRLNKTTTFTAQVLASNSNMRFFFSKENIQEDRRKSGAAYAYNLNMDGRNWGYEYTGVGRSPHFRAELGFNRRFNTHNQHLFVRYKSNDKPKARLVSFRVFNSMGVNIDWQGRSQNFQNETQLQLNFQKQGFIGFGAESGYERLNEDEFGTSRDAPCIRDPDPERRCTAQFFGSDPERSLTRRSAYFFAGATPSKKYSLFVFSIYNWGIHDLDFGAGRRFPRVSPAALRFGQDAPQDPGSGNEWYMESNVTYQPSDALRLSLEYTKDRLTRHDTGLVAFDDNIFILRGTYQFTRFIFARARLDYTTLAARTRAQLLWGYTPNPGTAFYIGYNDDLNRNGFNPFVGRNVAEPGFRRNGRTFFIKASYLIRRSF